MNVIDFIRESAAFLVWDRPDLYDQETAVEELSSSIDTLREFPDKPLSLISFSSYLMTRFVDDGVEEFLLTRKLSSILLFEEEEECRVYTHVEGINLPSILDDSQDL